MTKKPKLGRSVTTREFKLAAENAKVKALNKVLTSEVSNILQDLVERVEKIEKAMWGEEKTNNQEEA